MRCHYEVLNIARDADQSEIKAAYRKLALKWHPDKNLDDPDEAKLQFQSVQQAYEVLSDLQERAWYDNHREEILRGGQTNYEDESLDVFQYFTSSCFKGYDDGPESFYSVYSEVFSKLATEDIEYMDSPDEYEDIPKFGNSQSPYDVVHLFYSYWQSYSTKKSYAWLSPYNINETRDRRVIKLIDKENKKVQQKARRERNEQVKQLVQFVRKRDKRVIAQRKIEEERARQNKTRAEMMRKEQIRQRHQELSSQVNTMKMDDLESRLREIERNLSDEFGNTNSDSDCESDFEQQDCSVNEGKEEGSLTGNKENGTYSTSKGNNVEEYSDNLYCVACNKVFKTTSSFKNHENSKKHKERVAILLEDMINSEEENVSEDTEDEDNNDDIEQHDDADTLKEEKNDQPNGDIVELPEENDEVTGTYISSKPKRKSKNKQKTKPGIIIVEHEEISETSLPVVVSDHEDAWDSKNKGKQKKSRIKNKSKVVTENKTPQENITKKSTCNISDNKQIEKLDIVDTDHVCVTCNQNFPSKNKLFTHLKSTGHGVALNPKNIKKDKQSNNKRR